MGAPGCIDTMKGGDLATDLQNLPALPLASCRAARLFCRRRHRPRRRLYPLFHRHPGRGDSEAALFRPGGSAFGGGGGGSARPAAALRAFAGRRAVSAPLRFAAARGGAVGQAAAAAQRRQPRLSGARRVINALARLAQPLLAWLDAETAHRLTVNAMAWSPAFAPPADDPRLSVNVLGVRFPNPIGLAAGFDKNAEVPDGMLGLGFGFVEIGTLTPRPQDGNPRPRVFRLVPDEAVVNRLGFNNDGYDAAVARLAHRRRGGLVR